MWRKCCVVAKEAIEMDPERFYDLIRDEEFDEAHRCLDTELQYASQEDAIWLHHRRVSVYLGERRYEEAVNHLKSHRNSCGTVTSVHESLAMIYEITGQDDLALNELETAPYDADQDIDPLLVADARFYRLYFRACRKLPIAQAEIDAFPPDYETYLPAAGKMRGVLVKRSDIVDLVKRFV
jgi:hypothetical protein